MLGPALAAAGIGSMGGGLAGLGSLGASLGASAGGIGNALLPLLASTTISGDNFQIGGGGGAQALMQAQLLKMLMGPRSATEDRKLAISPIPVGNRSNSFGMNMNGSGSLDDFLGTQGGFLGMR